MSVWVKIVEDHRTHKLHFFCKNGHEVGGEDETCQICMKAETSQDQST
jgi:hypothetical protein